MTNITVLLISLLLLQLIAIVFISRNNKVRKKEILNQLVFNVKNNLDSLEYHKWFSKPVLEIYHDILNNPQGWNVSNDYYLLERTSDGLKIWAANSVDARRFYTFENDGEKAKNKAEEDNKNLTYYDKVLLDKIIKAYKNKQDNLVTKFFIL